MANNGKSGVATLGTGLTFTKVLFRVWAPHLEGFGGNPVRQVVVPEKFWTLVIQVTHDNTAGHLGFKKTNYKLSFWPCMTFLSI